MTEVPLHWIPLLPLLGALTLGVLGSRLPNLLVGLIGCGTVLGAFALSLRAVGAVAAGAGALSQPLWSWIPLDSFPVDLGLRVDGLSGVMIALVTGVGFLIHLYSAGYMKGEKGYWRYFAYLNLFVGMMLLLVLADNLVLLFLGWEGVGLCSYFLIGFWYTDKDKAAAGLKAMLVNRIGDAAFLVGMVLIAANLGTVGFAGMKAAAPAAGIPAPVWLTAACLLLFFGACGKSAQIPLFVWLPDAMAGPTPVSALIHAATMVTAGVYMVARLHFLFAAVPAVLTLIAWVGAATCLFAALAACVQHDIKKVLAYSTISQLGLMFTGLGAGAYQASVFHLATHAFFKALLFLGAGSVIHALAGEQDIRKMGNGLWRKIPITFIVVAIAALASVAYPFAGYASKHAIFEEAHAAQPGPYWLAWTASIFTALYTARWIYRIFFAPAAADAGHGGHAHPHESPAVMWAPMAVLAGPAIWLGWSTFASPLLELLSKALPPMHEGHGAAWGAAAFSLGTAATGLSLAYLLYGPPAAGKKLLPALAGPAEFARSGFGVDRFYKHWIVTPIVQGAVVVWAILDLILIDGLVNALGNLPQRLAELSRRLQSGVASAYVWLTLLGGVVLLGLAAFAS